MRVVGFQTEKIALLRFSASPSSNPGTRAIGDGAHAWITANVHDSYVS